MPFGLRKIRFRRRRWGVTQAKDINDHLILTILSAFQGEWTMTWDLYKKFPDIPTKVLQEKIKSLIRRNLIGGCSCGCRGDFEITDKGLALIGVKRTKPYTGY